MGTRYEKWYPKKIFPIKMFEKKITFLLIGLDVAYDLHGQYTTDVIARESVRIIQKHNSSEPLFLYMAHAAVHSGNPYNPLPVPDSTVAKIKNIDDFNRRKFAGMLILYYLGVSDSEVLFCHCFLLFQCDFFFLRIVGR